MSVRFDIGDPKTAADYQQEQRRQKKKGKKFASFFST
jgi:hypothetical protein